MFKRKENLIILFNIDDFSVEFHNFLSSPKRDFIIFSYYFNKYDLYSGNYYKILDDALTKFTEKNTVNRATLICPDLLLSISTFSVPKMNAKRVEESIKCDIEKTKAQVEYSSKLISNENGNLKFIVSMVNEDILNQIKKVFILKKITLDKIQFNCVCKLNSVLQITNYKKENFIFLDIKENRTTMVKYYNSTVCAFSNFDFGYNILSSDKFINVLEVNSHTHSSLAVLQAKKSSKAKKLLVSEEIKSKINGDSLKSENTNLVVNENTLNANFNQFIRFVKLFESQNKITNEKIVNIVINIPEKFLNLITNFSETEFKVAYLNSFKNSLKDEIALELMGVELNFNNNFKF